MGSYVSIYNDSKADVMYCRYTARGQVFSLTIMELWSDVVYACQMQGYPADVIKALQSADVQAISGGGIIKGLSNVLIAAVNTGLDAAMSKKHFGRRGPGAQYVSEKQTLSLVLQANIVQVHVIAESNPNANDGNVTAWIGTMNVITAATDGNTNTYKLSGFQPGNASASTEHTTTTALSAYHHAAVPAR